MVAGYDHHRNARLGDASQVVQCHRDCPVGGPHRIEQVAGMYDHVRVDLDGLVRELGEPAVDVHLPLVDARLLVHLPVGGEPDVCVGDVDVFIRSR